MPFTLPGKQALEGAAAMTSLSRRTEVPADAISATIPVWRFGHAVAEMTVHVRANYDERPQGGRHCLAADIWFENKDGDPQRLPDVLIQDILDEIHDHDGAAYREIEAASGKFERAA